MKYQVQLQYHWQNSLYANSMTPNQPAHPFARCALFRKPNVANVDTLPPTSDALTLHIMRAHYQTKVWKQSLVTHPQLPSPINCGWHMLEGRLAPQLSTEEPLQARCLELTVCECKESGNQCSTRHCLSKKRDLLQWSMWMCPCSLVQKLI